MVRCVSRQVQSDQLPSPLVVESGTPCLSDSLPAGLRLAQQGDQERLFDIFYTAYRENGYGGLDDIIVRDVIDKICHAETYACGLIDGAERIEAVLGLQPARLWYGDQNSWYWNELLFYVHPKHRQTRHAIKLFQFARWWERAVQAPVIINIFPTQRLKEKEHLFERYARPAGATYIIGNGEFRSLKAAS